ncbi:hypothetical protein SprV_0602239600 [Sparganum proliferum]
MNGILPLTYVFTRGELHSVSFRLKTSAAVKTTKCSLIRLVHEANLVQYRCHLTLTQVHITLERKAWSMDGVLQGSPRDILDVNLENVTADAYVTYLCDNTMINTLRQTGGILASRINEHKLAVLRGDVLSQVAAHTDETGHEFNFAATKIVAHDGNITGRELIEAYASDENSVNRSGAGVQRPS